jgi:antitoxin component YwqK of YwqJK toxin-antitoxin module
MKNSIIKTSFKIFVLCVLSAVFFACSDNPQKGNKPDTFEADVFERMVDGKNNRPITGIVINQFPDGTVVSGYYYQGNREGLFKAYRQQRLVFEIMFSNGKKNGVERYYDDEGNLTSETGYKNGVRHGVGRYYSNGKLSRESSYVNGKKEGVEYEYDMQDGRLNKKIIWKDDVAIGGFCVKNGKDEAWNEEKLKEFQKEAVNKTDKNVCL